MEKIYPEFIKDYRESIDNLKTDIEVSNATSSYNLINTAYYKSYKPKHQLFEKTQYLPKTLHEKILIPEILKINKRILENKVWVDFYRPEPSYIEELTYFELAENLVWHLEQNKNGRLHSGEMFEKLTDYLACLIYFDEILFWFENLKNGEEISRPEPITKPKPYQKEYKFETIFPDSVPDLFTELQNRNLITTTEKHFLWAFGVEPTKPADFKTIIWHEDNTLLAYMIKEICTNGNLWKVGEYVFGKNSLAQDFHQCKGDPKDKHIIDDIIKEIG